MLPVAAEAALLNLQSGISTNNTYFRGLAAVWNSPNGTGFIAPGDIFGEDFSSNFSPAVVQASAGPTRNGSTLVARSQGVSRGFYASSNYAEINVSNVAAGHQYYAVGGTGSKTAIRVVDPFELARRATFTWTVTGSTTTPVGAANSRLDFGYSTDVFSDWFDLFVNPGNLNAQTFLGPGTYRVTVPLQADQTMFLHFWSSAFTQINPGDAALGSNFRLVADFASTFVLEAIDLFDENDSLLTYDWEIIDEDFGDVLFTAAGRVAPIDGALPLPPVVPVPAPAVLLVSALGLLAARRRLSAAS
jgi:hypothetical protein